MQQNVVAMKIVMKVVAALLIIYGHLLTIKYLDYLESLTLAQLIDEQKIKLGEPVYLFCPKKIKYK